MALFLAFAAACPAQQAEPWHINGLDSQSQFESRDNTNFFSHGVMVSNETTLITAEQAAATDLTGEVVAEGDVTILDHGHIWRGTNFIYNFKTGDVRAGSFKTGQMPFSVSGEHLTGNSNRVYTATNAAITTDDYERSAYRIRARQITIVPGDYFEAHQATFYIGKTPVFYWPYYKRKLGQHPNNWQFAPGYRSMFGPYLLSAYNWYGTGLLDGTIHFDERERRGLAGGPDLWLHGGDWGEAAFRYYFARDQDPGADGIAAPHLKEDRQRMSFYYEDRLGSNATAKVVANYQSDPLVIRDFYLEEYNANVEPASFAEATQLRPNWVLDGMAQPRLVNFFETVERLPDVKLTGLRQEVGVTPVYYESESSVGYYERAFSNTNSPSPFTNITLAPDGLGYFVTRGWTTNPANYTAARADTFHQFTLPETFFGWLNITPRMGGRATYYSDVNGPQVHTNQQARGVFNTGVDVSFKAARVFRDAENSLLDVHELRHIIEPDIDYGYVPAPTRSASQLPQFDYQQPSLRQLPLEYPGYNSIDSIGSQNVLRLMLRNKLQTKRQDGLEDLVNWAVYTDWNLSPGTNHAFTDFYSDLDLRPRSWLTFNSSTRYDLADSRWREAIERIFVQPTTAWSLSLGYYYLMNNDPEFQSYPGQNVPGNNLIDFSLYYRMNENWGARITERFEAQNGTMQEQIYSIYRDLRSWTSALTVRLNQGPGQPTDFTIAITFSLKADPRYRLNSDNNRPSLLMSSATPADLRSQY
jgi:lipopolysaccharide assembly outer membrane protein LptD (OstA)